MSSPFIGAAVSAPRDFWQADPDDPAGGFPLAPLPPALVAGLELAAGGEVTAGGSFAVMGTSGSEQVTMLHGTFTFDDTFGHGNDTLSFDAATSAFTAVRDSASAVLDSATLDAHIPGGASGTTLAFTNDSRDLVYLSDTDTMTIGTQIITNTAAPLIA